MTVFATRLRDARIKSKITQKAAAQYLGIYESSYQYYEYGKREPNFDTVTKLCRYFNVSADYLLGLTDEPTSPILEEVKRLKVENDNLSQKLSALKSVMLQGD